MTSIYITIYKFPRLHVTRRVYLCVSLQFSSPNNINRLVSLMETKCKVLSSEIWRHAVHRRFGVTYCLHIKLRCTSTALYGIISQTIARLIATPVRTSFRLRAMCLPDTEFLKIVYMNIPQNKISCLEHHKLSLKIM